MRAKAAATSITTKLTPYAPNTSAICNSVMHDTWVCPSRAIEKPVIACPRTNSSPVQTIGAATMIETRHRWTATRESRTNRTGYTAR